MPIFSLVGLSLTIILPSLAILKNWYILYFTVLHEWQLHTMSFKNKVRNCQISVIESFTWNFQKVFLKAHKRALKILQVIIITCGTTMSNYGPFSSVKVTKESDMVNTFIHRQDYDMNKYFFRKYHGCYIFMLYLNFNILNFVVKIFYAWLF